MTAFFQLPHDYRSPAPKTASEYIREFIAKKYMNSYPTYTYTTYPTSSGYSPAWHQYQQQRIEEDEQFFQNIVYHSSGSRILVLVPALSYTQWVIKELEHANLISYKEGVGPGHTVGLTDNRTLMFLSPDNLRKGYLRGIHIDSCLIHPEIRNHPEFGAILNEVEYQVKQSRELYNWYGGYGGGWASEATKYKLYNSFPVRTSPIVNPGFVFAESMNPPVVWTGEPVDAPIKVDEKPLPPDHKEKYDPIHKSGWKTEGVSRKWWKWTAHGPEGERTGFEFTEAQAEKKAKKAEKELRNANP